MNAISQIEDGNPLNKLRAPFPPNQISKLPKESRKQADERKTDRNKIVWKCDVCGGMHHKDAVHLDYVGHAAATDRLLDTDPDWTWEPLAVDQRGLPAFDENGGLWIRLTVCGVTRIGYGSADGKSGGDAKKEIIGDAIRNAGMRFGMALDLWHKGDLHADDDQSAEEPKVDPLHLINEGEWNRLSSMLDATKSDVAAFCKYFKVKSVKQLPAKHYAHALSQLERKLRDMAPADPAPTAEFTEISEEDLPY